MEHKSGEYVVEGKNVTELKEHKSNTQYHTTKQQVFLIGSKGIPASYGGFETFVEQLTKHQKKDNIRYHVARLGGDNKRFLYQNAKCFNVNVPSIGPAKAVYYDVAALFRCIHYCKARPNIKQPVFYILACRIGPFARYFSKQIKKLGGNMYVNPDGHEWKRAKWSLPIRWYWKKSEQHMVKYADLLICDSRQIERYIQMEYQKYKPKTTYISYGSEAIPSVLEDQDKEYQNWLKEKSLQSNEYYLVVGRFVPENNYETMIREFMRSNTSKSFALITNVSTKFLEELKDKTGFLKDPRIKFVGTVYNQELLKKIRENAYGYFHGHEVGGTNPSLLEALASTNLCLLLDVPFNREVAMNTALYWTKQEGSLASLIEVADALSAKEIHEYGEQAKERMNTEYNWDKIVQTYEELFTKHSLT